MVCHDSTFRYDYAGNLVDESYCQTSLMTAKSGGVLLGSFSVDKLHASDHIR